MKLNKDILISSIISAIVALIIIFVAGLVGNSTNLGATIGITRYPNSGLAARGGYFSSTMPTSITDNTLTVSGTSTLGVISASGAFTATGAATFSSTFSATGAATFSNTLTASATTTISGPFFTTGWADIQRAATSTLRIGTSGSTNGMNVGCIEMYDKNATSTVVYVYYDSSATTTGLTVSTTTNPGFCR